MKDKILEIVKNELGAKGFDLVDMHISYHRKTHLIQVLADKPEGGITVDECVKLNKDIGNVLEAQDFLDESYVLEVSSPGIDWELHTRRDFARVKGKDIHLFLDKDVCGKGEYQGMLIDVDEKSLKIKVLGEEILVPLEFINKATQII